MEFLLLRHGKGTDDIFSCKGIRLAVGYFLDRGHRVEVFLPRFRRGENPVILDELERKGILKYVKTGAYDDRVIVQAAIHHDGIIISNDQYRDLQSEKEELKREIPKRFGLVWFDSIQFASNFYNLL